MKEKQQKRPLSPGQLAASHNNGKRSPGPTSEAGKRRSSQNAYKHGFYSDRAFPTQELIDRDGEGYLHILAAYRSKYSPVGDLENYYVEQIAVHSLRLARILGHEQKILAVGTPFEFRSMDRIVRYESNVSRLRDKIIDRLERLQEARKAEESQYGLSNPEADEAVSNTEEATDEPSEVPQEPIPEELPDVSIPSSGPAVSPATTQLEVESGAKQASVPVNGEQPNETPETLEGSALASVSILTKPIEKATGLPPAEEHKSSLGSHDNHETDSIGSNKWVESLEDEKMIEEYKRGSDFGEFYCFS